MAELDDVFRRANSEADEIFGRLLTAVGQRVEAGDDQLSLLRLGREAGLELDEDALAELKIPEFIPVHRFVPPYVWFPWRPLWCWWWGRRYPWYHCCPYWWHRCHFYN